MVAEVVVDGAVGLRSARRRRLAGAERRVLLAYALLAPSLAFLLLFTYLPILSVGWDALHLARHGVAGAAFVGLDNFARVLADPAFRGAVANNLLYAVGTIGPSLALALAFAVGLDKAGRVTALIRTVLFLPSLLPMVAAAALFFFIFMPRIGLLDFYLGKLGVAATNWVGDPDIALWSLTALSVWKNAGYYMLFYLAGLQSIPRDVYEAAAIDGAAGWRRLWSITLPLLKPTTAFVLVIALINVLTQVDHVIVLTKGGPSNSTNLVLFYIYQEAHENFDLGKAAAATVMSVGFLLAASLASLKTLERGFRHEG